MINIPSNVLSDLCAKYSTGSDKLKYLGGGKESSDGTTFTYNDNNKTNVLKILAIPEKETEGLKRLEERIKFANFLGENGIDLAYPKISGHGNLYETVCSDNHLFVAYKMDMCEGDHVKPEDCTAEFYQAWGKVIGKAHKITKGYCHWVNIPGNNENAVNGWQDELAMFYDWCKDEDVKQKWVEMRKKLSDLPFNRDTFGFIHNDNHTNNILWDKLNIKLIDFDVANCHFFINDIAVALQSLLFSIAGGMISPVTDSNAIRSALDNFMKGYEQENHLDDFWLQQINMFIDYRRLLLFTVMQEWLNINAELKQKYKYFIQNEPCINMF